MPLIDSAVSKIPGASSITSRKVDNPQLFTDDYPSGFCIKEFENGKPKSGTDNTFGASDVVLLGPFMPHTPFTFGGEQRLVSTYYPGNSEPSIQVMGSKEKDLTITGELKLKHFKSINATLYNADGTQKTQSQNLRSIAVNYQELIDAMRIRGNLVQLTMGEWNRWGFIQECTFDLSTLAQIKYTIKFLIVGFNKPINTKIASGFDDNLDKPNKDITSAALAAISTMSLVPTNMPRSVSEFLNEQTAKVAAAINLVTGFVADISQGLQDLNQSVNRAVGLIKNARAIISKSGRDIGAVLTNVATIGSQVKSEWQKTAVTVQSVGHIKTSQQSLQNLAALLALMQSQMQALATQKPRLRYPVKQGDTLQKISNKFYATPDHWQDIYSHNRLTTTQLNAGQVLEIPEI